jgi:UDP-glucose 4-epimerase
VSARPLALVTGAAGFIGSHVCARLDEAGYAVTRVGRGCERPEIDTATLAALGEPALVVHCAGGGSVGRSLAAPHADFADTVGSLAAVLEHLRTRAPAARLVLLSSAAVYGHAATLPIAETAPTQPMSPYGHHKLMAEQLCRSYAHGYGLHVAIVRFFSVYGPGLRKQLLWDACNKARAGVRTFAGSGRELRDFLHVADAVALIRLAAAAADARAPVINGGSGHGTSVAELVTRLYAALGVDGAPEFDGSRRLGDPPCYVADVSRAAALGFRPEVTLDEGIARYVRWFRDSEGGAAHRGEGA